MFETIEQEKQDEPILRPPNRFLKVLEKLKWKVVFAFGLIIFIMLLFMPSPTTEASYNSNFEETLSLVIVLGFLFYLIFLFFFWGFKAGVGVYKPQEVYSPKMTKKLEKKVKDYEKRITQLEKRFDIHFVQKKLQKVKTK